MIPIEIKVTDGILLDAGTIEETAGHFAISPPVTPMIDQLLAQLDEIPERTGDFKIEHLGVGFTALCVRWGHIWQLLWMLPPNCIPVGVKKSIFL